MSSSPVWQDEQLFFRSDDFFADFLSAVQKAEKSVDLEMYIFQDDTIGRRVIDTLAETAKRGVRVRLLVDGAGSYFSVSALSEMIAETGIEFRVYHPLPAGLFKSRRFGLKGGFLMRAFSAANKRNHRKVCIVDEKTAWAGSINVVDYHLEELVGDKAWRDTGIRVAGEGISTLVYAFERAWFLSKNIGFRRFKKKFGAYRGFPELLRLNLDFRGRRRHYRSFIVTIRRARSHVWVTTAYFVPRRSLLRSLKLAARRGADVRLLLPGVSDVFFIPWVSAAYCRELQKAGVRVFEYQRSMLHAKTISTDSLSLVGSTNLNHRSFMHDLEVDVVVTRPENQRALKERFLEDIGKAREKHIEDWGKMPWWQKLGGRILLGFRKWL